MPIEIDESDSLVNSIPVPACPGCRMVKNEWPGEGYTHDGETYCCQGCAEGTGYTTAKPIVARVVRKAPVVCASPSGNQASHARDRN